MLGGGSDAGPARTLIFLSDAPHLCAQLGDGGSLATPWNVLRFHLAGDVPGPYPVASVLAPGGASAEFDWEAGDAGGGFGFETGQSGQVNLEAVDPGNAQAAFGSYSADFGDAGAVTGRFTASPCPAIPPAPGP